MNGLEMKYFVLKPRGDFNDPYANASREAMRAYAKSIREESPRLAYDLENWALEEQHTANTADLLERLDSDDSGQNDG